MIESDVTTPVGVLLSDPTHVRWTLTDLRSWLNEGVRTLILLRPDAYSRNITHTLVAGVKQTLPAGALRLLDATTNITSTNARGKVLTYIDRSVLERQVPGWASETAADRVKHYMYDDRDPLNFYVYPPVRVGTKIEIVHSALPAATAAPSNDLGVPDIYLTPLIEFVLYRAYSIAPEFSKNPNLAAMKIAGFNTLLGVKTKMDVASGPNMNNKGAQPRKGQALGGV